MRRASHMWRGRLIASLAVLSFMSIGGYLILWPPLPRVPAIGRDLSASFSEDDAEFSRRVAAAFPVPMPEAELIFRLDDQGFSVTRQDAVFEKARFPCTLSWRVTWQVSAATVTVVTGRYGGACL